MTRIRKGSTSTATNGANDSYDGINVGVKKSVLWPKHYPLLDQFRGAAALSVVCFHCGFMPLGHWGVTLFFVISGYCILASSDSCMQKGANAREFGKSRFFRIYPPYLFALIFFWVTRLVKLWLLNENQLAQYSLQNFIQNLTLTQWTSMLVGKDPPFMVTSFWSLNYEVQFYAVMGLFILIARCFGAKSTYLLVFILTLICLVWLPWLSGFSGLFIDYWTVFAIGCLVYMRLCVFGSLWSRIALDGSLLILASSSLLAKVVDQTADRFLGHLGTAHFLFKKA